MQITQYVVVDTNEWIASKWFSTPVGKTFCDLISDTSMVLAIPEVLELELEKHRTSMLSDLLSRLGKHWMISNELVDLHWLCQTSKTSSLQHL
jgi:hypothetical protein